MARKSEVDKKMLASLEDSLASVLGESGAKAVMSLGNISNDKFDAKAIDSSLGIVFGASDEGLSIMQRNVLKGLSQSLGVGPTPSVDDHRAGGKGGDLENGFVVSLETLAARYRLKEKAGLGVAGFVAGIISSVCCLGPIAFALLGFASFSSSLALAMDLTSAYKPVELAASVSFLGVTVIFQLRRQKQCSLSGLRRNLAYITIPGTVLLVSYALLNYWLGIAFFGGPGSLLP